MRKKLRSKEAVFRSRKIAFALTGPIGPIGALYNSISLSIIVKRYCRYTSLDNIFTRKGQVI
jgi:hypothetical protein